MKGLKIIPLFLILILCTYGGLLFVEANRQEVVINLGSQTTPSTAIGFVVLTSILVGMIACGFLCSIEMLALYMQNRKLKRKLNLLLERTQAVKNTKLDSTNPLSDSEVLGRPSGRFT